MNAKVGLGRVPGGWGRGGGEWLGCIHTPVSIPCSTSGSPHCSTAHPSSAICTSCHNEGCLCPNDTASSHVGFDSVARSVRFDSVVHGAGKRICISLIVVLCIGCCWVLPVSYSDSVFRVFDMDLPYMW